MPPPLAPQPDLYRSHDKDLSTVAALRDQVHDFALHVSGGRSVRWQQEIDALTQALYFGLTKTRGHPTIGEEYTEVAPVVEQASTAVAVLSEAASTSVWAPPSAVSRRRHLFLAVILPYLYHRARVRALSAADDSDDRGTVYRLFVRLSRCVPVIDSALPTLNRVHLALFFLTGRFLTWSDRLTGTRYAQLRTAEMPRPRYIALGLIILVQLMISAIVSTKYFVVDQWRRHQQHFLNTDAQSLDDEVDAVEEESVEDDDDVQSRRQCLLHLGPLRAPTALLCGHVLCWRCLAECGKQKPECPLCRSPFKLEDLLRLSNYR